MISFLKSNQIPLLRLTLVACRGNYSPTSLLLTLPSLEVAGRGEKERHVSLSLLPGPPPLLNPTYSFSPLSPLVS